MDQQDTSRSVSLALTIFLIAIPILSGGLLFILFDTGVIHRLGSFLIGGGVIVGIAIILLRISEN